MKPQKRTVEIFKRLIELEKQKSEQSQQSGNKKSDRSGGSEQKQNNK